LQQNPADAGEDVRHTMPPDRLKRAYGALAARIPTPLATRKRPPPKQILTTASPTPVPPEPQPEPQPETQPATSGPDHDVAATRADHAALARTRSAQSDAGHEYPVGLKLVLILTALMTSIFLVALDRLIIATAIPQITDDFRSVTDIGWYGSAYLLATCAFQLMFGKLYTFWSIKIVFLTSVLLFEIGSAVCGAAPSSVVFIVGRAIAGVGAAGIFSGAVSDGWHLALNGNPQAASRKPRFADATGRSSSSSTPCRSTGGPCSKACSAPSLALPRSSDPSSAAPSPRT
jgi:hypothetical protein